MTQARHSSLPRVPQGHRPPRPVPPADADMVDTALEPATDAGLRMIREAAALQIASLHAVSDPIAAWQRESLLIAETWVETLNATTQQALHVNSLADLAALPARLWTRQAAAQLIHGLGAAAVLLTALTPPWWAHWVERSFTGADPAAAVG